MAHGYGHRTIAMPSAISHGDGPASFRNRLDDVGVQVLITTSLQTPIFGRDSGAAG